MSIDTPETRSLWKLTYDQKLPEHLKTLSPSIKRPPEREEVFVVAETFERALEVARSAERECRTIIGIERVIPLHYVDVVPDDFGRLEALDMIPKAPAI